MSHPDPTQDYACPDCKDTGECNNEPCDTCDPIIEPDCDICSDCKEHAEFREQSGSSCCGAGSYL